MTKPNREYGLELQEKRKAHPYAEQVFASYRDAGIQAYRQGLLRRDNPYPLSKKQEARAWNEGWDEGYHTEEPIHPDFSISLAVSPSSVSNPDGTFSPALQLGPFDTRVWSQYKFPTEDHAYEWAKRKRQILQELVDRNANQWNLEPWAPAEPTGNTDPHKVL